MTTIPLTHFNLKKSFNTHRSVIVHKSMRSKNILAKVLEHTRCDSKSIYVVKQKREKRKPVRKNPCFEQICGL